MNAVRVQIHLRYILDETSSKPVYDFWYAFHPSKLPTIQDVVQDIQENYLKSQLNLASTTSKDTTNESLTIHLDNCQLLPFSSSQILRDNDRLTLMPLSKYKFYKKTLEESLQLNLSSANCTQSKSLATPLPQMIQTQPTVVSENVTEEKSVEAVKKTLPSQSSITFSKPSNHIPDEPQTKKSKIKDKEEAMIVSPVKISSPKKPKLNENEHKQTAETSTSIPPTNGRMKEIKSKTPKWKEEKPMRNGDDKNKLHIRFDSDNDDNNDDDNDERLPATEKPALVATPVIINGKTNRHETENRPPMMENNPVNQENQIKETPKKTVDLLFGMKQYKAPEEKQAKKLQQQFAKKRAQHRKRALASISMANFIDEAFGVTQSDIEKQISESEYQLTISTPQSLPTSFSKLGRLPLIAEAVETNDNIYDLYPPLKTFPSTNSRIAFKLLELGEDFCPTMSKFKEAKVIDANETTTELTLELDQPIETVFDQPSKFYAPPEEDQMQDNPTMITVPLVDLHSVRLLSTLDEFHN